MQKDPLLEQLDWFLTSIHWTSAYPNTLVKPLGKPMYDHTPCIVNIETKIPRTKLFHFVAYWVLHLGFMEFVKKAWAKPVKSTNAATTLCRKFKHLRHELKIWSKNSFKLFIAIANSNKTLKELDDIEDKRNLTMLETNFRTIIKKHLL